LLCTVEIGLRLDDLLVHFMNVVFPQLEQIFNHTQAADILKGPMIKYNNL